MNFHDQLVAIVPKLRTQALGLTRQRAAAEDLVQDAICNALAASATFIPGSNFSGWMKRIVYNRFISNLRSFRPTIDIAYLPDAFLATSGAQEGCLALSELSVAMQRLPAIQLEALVLITLHGLDYEQLAEQLGCAVGTAKSRVHRARRQLHKWLGTDTDKTARPRRRFSDGPFHASAMAVPNEGLALS
jgi:RNA polymerase sigma-70 factor (ECF subfamily)